MHSFIEILDTCFEHIFSYIDAETKKSLRLVSKKTQALVNQTIIKISGEIDTEEHMQSLLQLLDKSSSLKCVEALYTERLQQYYYSQSPNVHSTRRNLMEALLSHRTIEELRVNFADLLADADFNGELPITTKLKKLDISNSNNMAYEMHLPDSAMEECGEYALRGLFTMTSLEYLNLRNSGDPEYCQPWNIAQWPLLKTLIISDQQGCYKKPKPSVVNFLRSSWESIAQLPSLECLEGTCVDADGLISQKWPHLTRLVLTMPDYNLVESNVAVDPSIQMVKSLQKIDTLQYLDLRSCSLSGKAVSSIQIGSWPRLEVLNLGGVFELEPEHNVWGDEDDFSNDFSDDPVAALQGLFKLNHLKELRLQDCGLTTEALLLIQPEHWPNLEMLGLSYESMLMRNHISNHLSKFYHGGVLHWWMGGWDMMDFA
jgi:hypothetical protein